MRRLSILVCVALALAAPRLLDLPVGAQAPAYYSIEDLGTLNGASLVPRAINNAGHVVGVAEFPGGAGAFLYVAGPAVAVPGFGWPPTEASGINDRGEIVGTGTTSAGLTRAFRYSSGGGTVAIEPLIVAGEASPLTIGMGINEGGQVAGKSGETMFRAFRHTAGVGIEDMSGPTFESVAYAINDAGLVTGCGDWGWGMRAFTASAPGNYVDLGVLDGVGSCGWAVNNAGQVAGWTGRRDGGREAVRFSPGTPISILALGRLGAAQSFAAGINEAGNVVGWVTDVVGAPLRAFLFTDPDGMVDLNTRIDPSLGWVLTRATAINDVGQIVGVGLMGGVPRAFRLTPPPPEPPPAEPPSEDPPLPPPADTEPPVIGRVTVAPAALWPPLGQMVTVAVAVEATDDSGEAPVCRISAIASDQADDTRGRVSGSPDHAITSALTAALRAELAPPRNRERTYTLSVECGDAAGNRAAGQAAVRVLRVPEWSNGKPGRR